MNSGGRANEAGSAHRSAVAAYLAVHGLAGRPLHALGSDAPTVVSLVLESGDAVDDIRCDLSNDTVLVLQAKNQCGKPALGDTLAQWAKQSLVEPTAGGGERRVLVGVVAERFKGDVEALPEALNRRRQSVQGSMSALEEKSITAVTRELEKTRDAAGDVLSTDRFDLLLDLAYAIRIDATAPSAPWRGEASAWLETLCAGSGHGDAAFDVLQHFFQAQQARRGGGSKVDDWLTVLANAEHPVEADRQGLIGQRRMDERRVLYDYRIRLASERDLLALSPLASRLEPMRVPDLLASFRVSVGKDDESLQERSSGLTEVARRWGCLVVTGLPGAGKSCALDQLTAAWAGDDDAPIPVRVRLRKITTQVDSGPDLTLDGLVERATDTSPQADRDVLGPLLVDALERGDAALLLDGLDECGAKAGAVADGIGALVRSLPGTSVVVTTRRSTSLTAAKIGIPIADLKTPSSLRTTLRHLVRHAAPTYSQEEDSAWVRDRQAQVERASALDRGLWSVPLLAVLMTLQIARRGPAAPATSRARLMADAVRASAERWLGQENALELFGRQDVRPEMMVEGFGIIGHALAAGDVVHRSDVVTAIDKHLRGERWREAPGDAEGLAGAVVNFWDQHVGAFLVGDDEIIEPRAVYLVEVGDAMWVEAQGASERARWVTTVIGSEDSREAAILAAGLSADALNDLVEAAASGPPGTAERRRGLDWAAEAAADHRGGAAAGTYERLIDALAAEAGSARTQPADESVDDPRRRAREVRDGPGWWWVRHLVGQLTSEQRVVADALRLLIDAGVDDQDPLPPAVAQACAALVELEVPDVGEQRVERASRRSPYVIPEGPHLLSGHADAAALMARHPEVLDDGAVAALHRVAPFASFDVFDAITASLAAASLPTPPSPFKGLVEWARPWADGEPYRWFLDAAAACGTPARLDRASRWRLGELATTAGLMRVSGVNSGFSRAREADSADVALVVGALADAHGVDRDRLAAQARYVEAAEQEKRRSLLYAVLAPEPPSTTPEPPATAMPAVLVENLLSLFAHPSTLLADAARDLLYATDDPEVGSRLLARARDMRPSRRWWAALVGTLLSADPADFAAELQESSDGPLRAGAVSAAVLLVEDGDDRATTVVTRSSDDPDFTVRLAGGLSQDRALRAEYWSCPDCASQQPIDSLDCTGCSTGARPGTHPRTVEVDRAASK